MQLSGQPGDQLARVAVPDQQATAPYPKCRIKFQQGGMNEGHATICTSWQGLQNGRIEDENAVDRGAVGQCGRQRRIVEIAKVTTKPDQ
jgi:hypothetical protein